MSEGTALTPEEQIAQAVTHAAFQEAEAKKAFKLRDERNAKLREAEARIADLEQRAFTPEQKAEYDELVEFKSRKNGDWDKQKAGYEERIAQITKKSDEDISAARTETARERALRHKEKIKAHFGSATALFGGHSESRTLLGVEIAVDHLGRYVSVEGEGDDESVVVRSLTGAPILGKDGRPAPFAEAMDELIKSLPHSQQVLRGGGKTGSGSSGGKTGTVPAPDVNALAQRAREGDKDAIEALKRHRAASGGIVFGAAFSK